jgi:hypothetical protein
VAHAFILLIMSSISEQRVCSLSFKLAVLVAGDLCLCRECRSMTSKRQRTATEAA